MMSCPFFHSVCSSSTRCLSLCVTAARALFFPTATSSRCRPRWVSRSRVRLGRLAVPRAPSTACSSASPIPPSWTARPLPLSHRCRHCCLARRRAAAPWLLGRHAVRSSARAVSLRQRLSGPCLPAAVPRASCWRCRRRALAHDARHCQRPSQRRRGPLPAAWPSCRTWRCGPSSLARSAAGWLQVLSAQSQWVIGARSRRSDRVVMTSPRASMWGGGGAGLSCFALPTLLSCCLLHSGIYFFFEAQQHCLPVQQCPHCLSQTEHTCTHRTSLGTHASHRGSPCVQKGKEGCE